MTNPIFENEAEILAQTYYHTAKVLRAGHTTDELGFDSFKDEVVYENIQCAVSFSSGSTENISDTTQAIQYIAILFARPEIDIKPGDWIIADVLGNTYEFRAGEGVVYQSHIEVPLMRKGDA